ncbi:MAG: ABC-three component system middle component 2 [Candidatus Thiodiazotropha sp.]
MPDQDALLPFNSALETGIRCVGILVAAYPQTLDLQRLVAFDYIVVHTGDVDGPDSLHPSLPMRSAELLVRRQFVERGLLLMISRGLVERHATDEGITYRAGEFADTFLTSLTAPYLKKLRERAAWVVEMFGNLDEESLRETMSGFFDRWIEEFHVVQQSLAGEI